MSRQLITFFIVFTFILMYSQTSDAKKLSGYIITENSDTIFGTIKVYSFNRRTGGWVFNGIDIEWCYLEATFQKPRERYFKAYSPDEIRGYGFQYNDQDYVFHSLEVNTKSISKRKRKISCFLNLVYNSNGFVIYKRQQYISIHCFNDQYLISNTNVPSYQYYVYSSQCGLKKIEDCSLIK